MDARTECEKHIFWKIGKGDVSFWWDNWTNKGALANLIEQSSRAKKILVSDFIVHNTWNLDKLNDLLPPNLVTHIQTINISPENEDYSIWTADPSGSFSIKSAWNALRTNRITAFTHTKIWHSKMPFKISFHVLRLFKDKWATDVNLSRFKVHGPSRCCCCNNGSIEINEHLFNEGEMAKRV